ncbi:hypothetical protein ACOTWR_06615 [Aliarcobacter butzleri]
MRKVTKKEAKKIIDGLVNENKVSRENINISIENLETICVNCGCSDYRACPNCCSWLDMEVSATFGICSNCEDVLDDWQ